MKTNHRSLLPQLWLESGLSQAEFCHEHGISVGTLHYWRRKAVQDKSAGSGVAGFVPVRLQRMALETDSGSERIEIELPGKMLVRLPGTYSQAETVRLILQLQESC